MTSYRMAILLSVWFLVSHLPGLHPSASGLSQPSTVRGLKALAVGISQLPPELKDIGLKEADLYSDVAEAFEKSGIRIITRRYGIAGDPDFIVDIFGGEFIEGVITYCIDIRLDQPVILERDPNIRSDATTWSQKYIGVAGYATPPAEIRTKLKRLVDLFVKDYISVNPAAKQQ